MIVIIYTKVTQMTIRVVCSVNNASLIVFVLK